MSDKLLKQYRDMAALGGNFRGFSLLQHAELIRQIVALTGAKSLLDYGSGAGDGYGEPYLLHRQWGIDRDAVRCYDPSFPELDEPIVGFYDGVLCSDVLEHIPEDEVDAVVTRLFNHARMFVWASVCCRPAKKRFADGTNMHVTVRPLEWWRDKFVRLSNARTFYLVETP